MMATYSASRNSVDLAIDPLITCKLCLSEYPLQDLYELKECKCLYCKNVSIFSLLLNVPFYIRWVHFLNAVTARFSLHCFIIFFVLRRSSHILQQSKSVYELGSSFLQVVTNFLLSCVSALSSIITCHRGLLLRKRGFHNSRNRGNNPLLDIYKRNIETDNKRSLPYGTAPGSKCLELTVNYSTPLFIVCFNFAFINMSIKGLFPLFLECLKSYPKDYTM